MILLKNANIVSAFKVFKGAILIDNMRIKEVYETENIPNIDAEEIDINGK